MSRRMLVLGAGGFIGRSLVEYVIGHGGVEPVLHYRDTSERLAIGKNLEAHVLDVLMCPMAALIEMFDRTSPDVVVNCIGLTDGQPDELRAANVDVVTRLIDVVEGRHGVHLVQLGSAAEYGVQRVRRPVSESVFAMPSSAYGRSKLEATERLMFAAARDWISVTVLRLFNPVGRYSPSSTLAGNAARKIDEALRNGADSVVLGALDSWRDYIDVRDIARAVLAVASSRPPTSSVLNVGRGTAVESLHLVRTLAAIAGYHGDIVEGDVGSARSDHVNWQCADVEAIRATLGWSAVCSIEDSLADLWSEIVKSRECANG